MKATDVCSSWHSPRRTTLAVYNDSFTSVALDSIVYVCKGIVLTCTQQESHSPSVASKYLGLFALMLAFESGRMREPTSTARLMYFLDQLPESARWSPSTASSSSSMTFLVATGTAFGTFTLLTGFLPPRADKNPTHSCQDLPAMSAVRCTHTHELMASRQEMECANSLPSPTAGW